MGTWNVAVAAARVRAELMVVSTNYVFDGAKLGPYFEFDQPHPINSYGLTKWQGEAAARQVLDRLFIVRTAWLYSRWRRNFVSTLLKAADEGRDLRYVGDQVANPTYARDLAGAIVQLAGTGAYGVHHLVNEGATSWYGWATTAVKLAGRADVRIEEIAATDYVRAAPIPANSELGNEAARAVGITLRPWGEALKEFIRETLA